MTWNDQSVQGLSPRSNQYRPLKKPRERGCCAKPAGGGLCGLEEGSPMGWVREIGEISGREGRFRRLLDLLGKA